MADNLWEQGQELTAEEEDALLQSGQEPSWAAGEQEMQPEMAQPNLPAPQPFDYTSPLAKEEVVAQAQKRPLYQFEKGPVKPKISVPEAQLRGFGQGASFGIYDELYGAAKGILTGGDPGEEVAYQQYMNKAAAEQQPYSYGGGQVAGAVALSAVPYVGAPAGLGALGRVGYGAAQGALTGLGEGETLPERAEKALEGAAIGGGVAGIAEPAVRGVLSKLRPSELKKAASDAAVKSAMASQSKGAKEMLPDYHFIGQKLLEPTEELGGQAVVRFGSKAADVADRAAVASEQVGQKMGKAVQTVDQLFENSFPMKKQRLLRAVAAVKSQFLPKAKGVVGSQDEKFLDQIYVQLSKVKTLDDLARIRTQLVYDPLSDVKTLRGTKSMVRSAINREIKDAIADASQLLGKGYEKEAKLLESYPELVAKYRAFQPTETYAEELAMREGKNRRFGLSSNIVGANVFGGARASGESQQAATMKAIIAGFVNQQFIERGNTATAVSLQKLGKALDYAPQPLQKFMGLLMKASEKGAANLAITHQALMNSNPEYRDIMEQQP